MSKPSIFITGASRGIGRATAKLFAQRGWQVGINYCNSQTQAESLLDEITALGGTAQLFPGDVSDSTQATHMIRKAEAAFGGLDALVCNAGVGQFALLSDVSDELWRKIMGVNLDGTFYPIRAAIPGMVSRQSGSIVTVSSMWGVTGGSCEVAYSSAKAGVIGLTKALAKELGPSHIRVNCVAPGVIATEMNGNLSPEDMDVLADETPLGRIGTPEEVAESIYFLVSPASAFVTGQILQTNGGICI